MTEASESICQPGDLHASSRVSGRIAFGPKLFRPRSHKHSKGLEEGMEWPDLSDAVGYQWSWSSWWLLGRSPCRGCMEFSARICTVRVTPALMQSFRFTPS